MSKVDIAARFMAMMFPQLFDDREKAEELALGADQREERPRPERRAPYQGGGRRFAGAGGGGGGYRNGDPNRVV